jgi:hypothetical protein
LNRRQPAAAQPGFGTLDVIARAAGENAIGRLSQGLRRKPFLIRLS